jgi:hypothetical protein
MTINTQNVRQNPKPSIAIIGSGVSGLVLAYLLQSRYEVLVLEKQNRIGGHANTIQLPLPGEADLSVDTGFIVYNDRNYPLFSQLLKKLHVKTQDSEMSFSAKHALLNLEYNGHHLNTLFAQRKNIFRPRFWKFLQEIMRFNRLALQQAEQPIDPSLTLNHFLKQHQFQGDLLEWYLLPMIAAIWSSSTQSAQDFPLVFFMQFFKNHGLLALRDRPQWRTISGGSQQYVQALCSSFRDKIITNSHITAIKREAGKVIIQCHQQADLRVDQVAFACHSDEALALLSDASADENRILSALPYRENQAIVHQDISIMPNSKRAWASWNYWLTGKPEALPIVTYDMNRLQSLPTKQPILVTLNGEAHIDHRKILRTFTYHHPQFQLSALAAQQQWSQISGVNHTHFCGAYWFNGFHEDGVRSAQRVSALLGGDQIGEAFSCPR